MDKERPDLVVVDDDTDVLNGLSSLFSRNFENIVQVEGFENPEHALNYLLDDNNNIAFLVTDLKMPNLQGDEFVTAFRKEKDIESIVVTGHGSKEQAFNLIKAGGIKDCFIKTEYDDKDLVASVGQGLASYFSRTKNDMFLNFKKPENIVELRDYLVERYLTWLELGWESPNKFRLNYDEYDKYSEEVCMFANTLFDSKLIGGVRNIFQTIPKGKENYFQEKAKMLEEILGPEYLTKDKDLRKCRIPIPSKLIEEKSINDYFSQEFLEKLYQLPLKKLFKSIKVIYEILNQTPDTMTKIEVDKVSVYETKYSDMLFGLPGFKVHEELLTQKGEKVSELGRLLITPEFRKYGGSEFLRGRFFTEIVSNYIDNKELEEIIICINPAQYPWYQDYGFTEEKEIVEQEYYPGALSKVYSLNLQELDKIMKPEILERSRVYKKRIDSKEISCYCANHKYCFPEDKNPEKVDYNKPLSKEVEYNCPVRIKNTLSPFLTPESKHT